MIVIALGANVYHNTQTMRLSQMNTSDDTFIFRINLLLNALVTYLWAELADEVPEGV